LFACSLQPCATFATASVSAIPYRLRYRGGSAQEMCPLALML
jgi:hypothetical protein